MQRPPTPPLQRSLDPAGDIVLDAEGRAAEGSLPVAFIRSPDTTGPAGAGRYLVVVNSGYGVQYEAKGNEGQQLLQVIDLNARPVPVVVQSVYFPSPQSVNVGVVFGQKPLSRGQQAWALYASGGFENRIWRLTFTVGAALPIAPAHDDGDTEAPEGHDPKDAGSDAQIRSGFAEDSLQHDLLLLTSAAAGHADPYSELQQDCQRHELKSLGTADYADYADSFGGSYGPTVWNAWHSLAMRWRTPDDRAGLRLRESAEFAVTS